MTTPGKKFIVVGGGIGGLAAAVALSQQGVHVTVLEQAAQLGEIGAGVQLGPNAFAALDALGVGETARKRAVFTERLIMMDAVDGSEVGSFPVGQAFRVILILHIKNFVFTFARSYVLSKTNC